MKVATEMVNAAMRKAVDIGLILDGVTVEQRSKLEEVLQASLDAHATLRSFEEINFRVLSDPEAVASAIKHPAQD